MSARRPRRGLQNTFRGELLLSVLFFCAAGPILPRPVQAEDEAATQKRAERLREMQRRAQAIEAYEQRDGANVKVELFENPLFRFDDPARELIDASAWVWGKPGRPVALVALERYDWGWSYEVLSLCSGKVSAVFPNGRRWTPREPGLQWKRLPETATSAGTRAARLRQMKTLGRRFEASETIPGRGRCQLRFLPQPIHRYSEKQPVWIDGAIFVFAYGTNAEILLTVECRKQDDSAQAWYYAFAPLSSAALSVSLEDHEVWTKPWFPGRWTLQEPYMSYTEHVAGD